MQLLHSQTFFVLDMGVVTFLAKVPSNVNV